MTSLSQLTVHVTDVNDHAPQFTDREIHSVEMPEDAGVGSLVARLTATDADAGENGRVSYELVDESDTELFAVDRETGALSTRALLDREAASRHRVVVAAVDAGTQQRSSTAVVQLIVSDVDDEPPRFSVPVYSLRVSENRPPGTEVGAVEARDSDAEPFNRFRFRMIADNESESFEIDAVSGLITTRASLDREQRALYRLTVVAETTTQTTSASAVSSTAVVNVQVNNHPRKLRVICRATQTAVISHFMLQ